MLIYMNFQGANVQIIIMDYTDYVSDYTDYEFELRHFDKTDNILSF